MKKRFPVVIIILSIIGIAFGYSRRSMVEINTNTGCPSCAAADTWLDEWFPLHFDEMCLLRYHTNGPATDDPFHLTNVDQNNRRAGMYSLGFVPLVVVNGIRQDDWSTSGPVAESQAGVYTPFELEVFPVDSGICRVRLTCQDGGYDNMLNLFCVLSEDSMHYAAPNGHTEFHQVMRYMLPSAFGEPIHVDGDTVIEREFDFTPYFTYTSYFKNCWYTVFIQDFTTDSSIIQCDKRATLDLLDYYHNVKTDRFRELVAPDDTTVFDFAILNFGRNADQYDVWFEEDVPAGWSVDVRSGGAPFDSTRISVVSKELQDFELHMSPCGDVGYGNVYLYVRPVDDPDARTETFHFKAYSGGDMLLISSSAATDDIPYYEDLFTDEGIEFGIWSMEEHGLLPDITNLAFDAIVWNDGINLEDSIMFSDREGMIGFLENGGKMLITSGSMGRDIGNDHAFYHLGLGVDYDGLEFGVMGVMGTYPGTDFTGYSCMLPGLPTEGVLARAGTGSEGILRLNVGPTCGIQKTFTTGGGKLVYITFMLETVASETERDDFWDRVVEFWGGVGVEERKIPESVEILSASPNPFNGALSIEINSPVAGDLKIEAFDVTGMVAATIFDGTISAGTFDVRWKTGNLSSGLYLIRATGDGFSVGCKTLLLK